MASRIALCRVSSLQFCKVIALICTDLHMLMGQAEGEKPFSGLVFTLKILSQLRYFSRAALPVTKANCGEFSVNFQRTGDW